MQWARPLFRSVGALILSPILLLLSLGIFVLNYCDELLRTSTRIVQQPVNALNAHYE